MKIFNCKKCNSEDVYIKESGTQKGLYCGDCGKWIQWLGKADLRLAERLIESNKHKIKECKYCEESKSLFWCQDTNEHFIREVYLELDGSMTVTSNIENLNEWRDGNKWGIYARVLDDCNFKINFCPMCGRKLTKQ